MSYLSRRTKTIFVFLALITVGYASVRLWQGGSQVSKEFTDARLQGAAIAMNIVTLSAQSTKDLQKVNQYDEQGNYTDALTLTTDIVVRSQQIRDQAIALSAQIENMTKSLSSLNSGAQQAALEAITSRLALVTQLINYSGDLETLLDTLRNRFAGIRTPAGKVQTLVNQINTDVTAVNNFNAQATQAMTKFDSIMAR